MDNLCAVILAAGKGTRMHSQGPKVLRTLLGEPMLHYVYSSLEESVRAPLWTVVGHRAEEVEAAFPERRDRFILQAEQLGTGHALQVAWDRIRETGARYCLVVNGDTPLLPPKAVERLLDEAGRASVSLAFLSIVLDDPAQFGRVVRKSDGGVGAIIEAKDFDSERHGPLTGEINAGIYLLDMETMGPLLGSLGNDNKSGEYYITDLVDLAVQAGLSIMAVKAGDDPSLMGINTALEMSRAEKMLRSRIVRSWMEKGVLVRNPESVIIGPRAALEPGAEVCGPCEIYGETTLAAEAVVESHCVVIDSRIGDARIRSFSHLERAEVGPGCVAGPYARLRPGAVMLEGSRVGNFVEVKKAILGPGAKAGHLTYLGDAEVGEEVNIGAGTITCNYDGKKKHKTVIRKGAFIGSNTALVAPVTVGENALVGAGSTITKDVGDDELAVGRARQTNLKRRNRS